MKHTEEKAIRSLNKKKDCLINRDYKVIQILTKNKVNDLGNKSWGKIDFLQKHAGYTVKYVPKFLKENELLILT